MKSGKLCVCCKTRMVSFHERGNTQMYCDNCYIYVRRIREECKREINSLKKEIRALRGDFSKR